LWFAALVLSGFGCQREQAGNAKIVVAFVDVSASVKDYEIYREAWVKIRERLQGGDRLVLGRIKDETYTQFRPVVDHELPAFNFLTDNKLRYEKKVKEIHQEFSAALEKALAAPRSAKTDVINTLVLAEKIFAGDKRRRVLVILSDMLEDSDDYNFEKVRIIDEFTRHVIEDKRRRAQLPDLGGAIIYVAGASAHSASKAHEVQRFWLEYMKAANARLLPQNYGPALVNFNE